MVLGRNISGRIEVCMQLEATRPTHKATARTAVVAGLMPTAATGLRGMSRINCDHRTAPFFGFVRDKRADLRVRPTMHAARCLGFAPDRGATTDIGEVLKDNRCARLTRLDNLLTQDVIAILPKPCLLASQVSQVPFGRWGALALELPQEGETRNDVCAPAACTTSARPEHRNTQQKEV